MNGVLVIELLQPAPGGNLWLYMLGWFSSDHPYSGLSVTQFVGDYALLSKEDAWEKVAQDGVRQEAEKKLLEAWMCGPWVH